MLDLVYSFKTRFLNLKSDDGRLSYGRFSGKKVNGLSSASGFLEIRLLNKSERMNGGKK